MNEQERLDLLIVDDSAEDRLIYERLLRQGAVPADVVEAEDGATALDLLCGRRFDCVMLDYRLPDMTGADILEQMAELGPEQPPVIMLTGNGTDVLVADVMKAGASDYLPKSQVSAASLSRAITNAVEKAELQRQIRERQEELESTVEYLRRSNEEIRSFYHTMSHELKTPLTAATEFLALVLDDVAGPLNDEQREYIEIARENCVRLTKHINDVLDASRLETGKLSLERRECSPAAIVESVRTTFGPTAQRQQITLSCDVADSLPEVFVDEGRVVQVLSNLMSNALKFTQTGGTVTLSAATADDGESVRIAVADTGRGIESERLPLIFDRLYQTSADDTVIHGGLGLGLSICRDLVRLHGGTIGVESEVGRGSTFLVTLPAAVVAVAGE